MPNIRHKRGTRAALAALASSSGLLPGQVYVLTDEARIAVALTTSTFETFAKESEAGGAVFLGDTAPSTATYQFWVTTSGAFYVADGSVWVQIPGTPGADGAPAAIAKVTVSVAPAQFGQAEVSAAALGALPTHTVLCQLVPSAEWDADDLTGLSVIGVAGTDTITFTIAGEGPIVGALAIAYQIG